MASLTGNTVGSTYGGLLKTTDNADVTGTLKTITGGTGTASALQVSTAGIKSTGTLEVTGASTLASATLSTPLPLASGGTASATAVLARNVLNKGETAITDAATIATDCSLGNVFTVTLGGNRALGAPTNLAAGATYIWRFTQDGAGSRTLSFNSVFKFAGGVAPTLTTTAAAVDIVSGVSNGTNIYCSAILDVK